MTRSAAWVWTVGAVLTLGPLSGCATVTGHAEAHYQPAVLETIAGTTSLKVTLTDEAARNLGLETMPVRQGDSFTLVPSAAIIYLTSGQTVVYTSPEPLTYVRADVTVRTDDGTEATLSAGPPVGTLVVTTGAALVYGTEFKVGK